MCAVHGLCLEAPKWCSSKWCVGDTGILFVAWVINSSYGWLVLLLLLLPIRLLSFNGNFDYFFPQRRKVLLRESRSLCDTIASHQGIFSSILWEDRRMEVITLGFCSGVTLVSRWPKSACRNWRERSDRLSGILTLVPRILTQVVQRWMEFKHFRILMFENNWCVNSL